MLAFVPRATPHTLPSFPPRRVTVKLDSIEGMEGRTFVQVQGKDRCAVGEAARRLGLDGSYIPHSYIEVVSALLGPYVAAAGTAAALLGDATGEDPTGREGP